jgi:tRNA-dihydrouridine synthase
MNRQRGVTNPVPRRTLPLSVKTRLGYEDVTVETWLEHLLLEHPVVISLHGRTLRQMYKGTADWSAIARAAALVKGTGTWLLGNGDIHNLQEAAVRVGETGADGVLVGRGALGAPWLFRAKEQFRAWSKGIDQPESPSDLAEKVSLDERFAVLREHAHQFQTIFGERQFYRMRKHLGWYCKGFPHAASLRARMVRVSSVEELNSVLSDFQSCVSGEMGMAHTESSDDADLLTSRCS